MKKLILGICLISLFFLYSYAQENDVRNLKWGMTSNQVKGIEKLADSNFLDEQLFGFNVSTHFEFFPDELFKISYTYIIDKTGQIWEQDTEEIPFFMAFKKNLIEKYGNPSIYLDNDIFCRVIKKWMSDGYRGESAAKLINYSENPTYINSEIYRIIKDYYSDDEIKYLRYKNRYAKYKWEKNNTIILLSTRPRRSIGAKLSIVEVEYFCKDSAQGININEREGLVKECIKQLKDFVAPKEELKEKDKI